MKKSKLISGIAALSLAVGLFFWAGNRGSESNKGSQIQIVTGVELESPKAFENAPEAVKSENPPAAQASGLTTLKGAESLPQTEQQSLWKAFSDARHEIRPLTERQQEIEENEDAHFFAQNPKNQLVARFMDDGVKLGSGYAGRDWEGKILLNQGEPLEIRQEGTRVEYDYGSIVEFYHNRPEGVMQGWIVDQPLKADNGFLVLGLEVLGLKVEPLAEREDGVSDLQFVNEAGEPVVSYSGLKAWDANGVELETSMELMADGFQILVADSGAAYPITIDPLIASLEQKLIAGDGASSDWFGWSVSVSGDTALIGAYRDDDNGSDSGSAYVFTRSGGVWSQEQKLTAGDGASSDYFGWSVSVSGDTALIGAYQNDANGSDSGSAYVFTRSGSVWSQEQKLTAGDGSANDYFGESVSVSGDTALIGAYRDDDNGLNSGSAYVFTRSGGVWSQEQKLTAGDGSANDYFGESVSVSGDTALIGAYLDDDNGSTSGSAYVFTRSGGAWSQQQKLIAGDGAVGDYFGWSVSESGDTALIGAHRDDDNGGTSGSAYVFTRSGGVWSQEQKLTAGDGAAQDYFGESVSVSGDTALIGARLDDDNGDASGSAYVFTRSGGVWSQQSKLTASDGASLDVFGSSVSVDGDTALIGAYLDEGLDSLGGISEDQGSVHVFRLLDATTDTDNDGIPDAYETNTGTYVSATDTGSDPNVADTDGDGVEDGDEINTYGSNPNNSNTDGDAFDDGLEVAAGTDPDDANDEPLFGELEKLAAADAAASDWFGYSVSVNGDTALIGARLDDDNGNGSGSAYVYVRSGTTWALQQKLTAGDGADNDHFGISVSVSGDTALIGAFRDNDNGGYSGSAYVYVRSGTTWAQQQKLTAGDGAASDQFGWSVSVDGDTALIGAFSDDDNGNDSGSAYVYVRSGTTWAQEQKLTAGDGADSDYFGRSVSVDGDTALIGAYGDDDNGTDSGSAYVYVRSGTTWTQQQKLTAGDGATGDWFGYSVSMNGDTALIGAHWDDDNGSNAGSAYVYERSGPMWTQQGKLTAGDGAANDWFGWSVSVSGDTALIGAYQDDDNGSNSGSAYVYVRSGTTWAQEQKLTAGDGADSDYFGRSVSVDGDTALIGAYGDDDNGTDSGSAYIFELTKDNDLGSTSWQIANGFDPDVPNDEATLDSDGDGDLDIVEIFQGTDKNSSGESFGFQQTTSTANGLSTQYRKGDQNLVQATGKWSKDLVNWYNSGETAEGVTVNFTEQVVSSGTGYQIVEVSVSVDSGTAPELFYRIELNPIE